MGFSRHQQPAFRILVKQAWAVHCRTEGMDVKHPSERSWYEAELLAATGHASTKNCGAGRHYDLAMAHFEELAMAGIEWQLRVYSGDAKRIIHVLQQYCDKHDVDADYLRRVARNGYGKDAELHTLTRDQLIVILGEVKRFVRRRVRIKGENEPF